LKKSPNITFHQNDYMELAIGLDKFIEVCVTSLRGSGHWIDGTSMASSGQPPEGRRHNSAREATTVPTEPLAANGWEHAREMSGQSPFTEQ
jgi:hypothetical protein